MQLAFHQLRHDIRAFRWFLLAWFAVLGIDLANNMGWTVSMLDLIANRSIPNLLIGCGILGVLLFSVYLPILVVNADSPLKRERFLSTRPMPNRDLFLAKALFVLLLIVLPAVAQEFVHLVLKGLPLRIVLHGVGERLLFLLPIVTLYAVLPLVNSDAKWSAVTTVSLVCFGLSVVSHVQRDSSWIIYVYLAVAGITGIAVLGFARDWPPALRVLAVPAWLLVVGVAAWLWPLDLFAIRAEDPSKADALGKTNLSNMEMTAHYERDSTSATAWGTPKLDPKYLCTVEWDRSSGELAWKSGARSQSHGWSASFSVPVISPRDIEVFDRVLGDDVISLRSVSPQVSMRPINAELGSFYIQPMLVSEPSRITANLSGSAFCWRKSATLPIAAQASISDEIGRWTCLGISKTRNQNRIIAMQLDQVTLITSRDPVKHRRAGSGLSNGLRTEWWATLYDVKRRILLLPNMNQSGGDGSGGHYRGVLTAFPSFGFSLEFPQEWDPKDLQIVVLQKIYLGPVQREWKSTEFKLEDYASNSGSLPVGQEQAISEEEIQTRLSNLNVPLVNATRAELGNYVYEVLRLVELRKRSLSSTNSTMANLVRFVPSHLDTFLDGVSVTSGAAQDTLLTAIQIGANESQQEQIFKALRNSPDLARVIAARGWVQAGRSTLVDLLQSPRPIPMEAVEAIASFRDPSTYPGLVAKFESSPRASFYQAIRDLPGIQELLDPCVNRLWAGKPRLVDNWQGIPDEVVEIALEAGKPEALQWAYRLFADVRYSPYSTSSGAFWAMGETLKRHVQPPANLKNSNEILGFLESHRAQDFRFDPALRKFVPVDKTLSNRN